MFKFLQQICDIILLVLDPVNTLKLIKKRLKHFQDQPRIDKIRNERIVPSIEHIIQDSKELLPTEATTEDILKLIEIFPPASGEMVGRFGKIFSLPLTDLMIREETLKYDYAIMLTEYVFDITTDSMFKRYNQVGEVIKKIILEGAMNKISPDYGLEYISKIDTDDELFDDIGRLILSKGVIKEQIIPLIKKKVDEKTLIKKIKSLSIENNMYGPRLTDEQMVKLAINNEELLRGVQYEYARGLRYIYRHKDSRQREIVAGANIAPGTMSYIVRRHLLKTKLIEKTLKGKRPCYHVSKKFNEIKAQIEDKSSGE